MAVREKQIARYRVEIFAEIVHILAPLQDGCVLSDAQDTLGSGRIKATFPQASLEETSR
jgi:hypothetical protein